MAIAKRSVLVTAFFFLPFLHSPLAHSQESPPPDLDPFVESVMKTFDVPGIGLTIVKDGRVVIARGYGVKTMGAPEPVDGKTLFGIASNSKAFTATALALLVEEGKIEWDAPVIDYVPWFQLSDPYVTREMTVRDLLVHRSGLGLGAGDLLWWPPSTYDRKEITRRLRYLPLAASFRSAYAYDNVLYTVAGEVIEAVSGQTWEEFVESRILKTVGMEGSNVLHSLAGQGKDAATPHARIDGKVRTVNPFASDNTNPAGGINSSAEDMAKWLILQLDSGRVAGGSQLFSPGTTRQLWRLVTPMPNPPPPPFLAPLKSNFRGYALGFEVRDYRGAFLVTHTGGLPGYLSKVALLPELKLGIAVLTNQESGAAYNAITYAILDHYLGAPAFDWISAMTRSVARSDSIAAEAEKRGALVRDAKSSPSLPLRSYAGTYTDAWYGDVLVTDEKGKLVVQFSATPSLLGDLEHWQYDTFVVRWRDRELRADAFLTFSLNPDGSISRASMKPVSPATDFSFDFQDLDLRPARRR